MPDWFEDESFWEELYPYLFTEERLKAGPEEVEQILELTGSSPNNVLDLACGPGRHAIPLAANGIAVTGVDTSEYLLGKAKTRASEAGVEAEWRQEDMRRFRRAKAFDLAINLYSSFGYFEDDKYNFQVLENVYASLRNGGALVLDMHGKESLARRFEEVRLHEYEDGTLLLDHPEIEEGWKRVKGRWTLIRGDEVKRFSFSLRLYSGEEIEAALRAAGFSKGLVYGDLEGNPYGLEAKRLVAVGIK